MSERTLPPTEDPQGVPIMTLEQWAAANGRVTSYDVQGHLHAGLRSAPQTKTYQRWNTRKLRQLQNARDETVRLYNAAIERGEVVAPIESRKERLERIAGGHPDNPAVQAARRLLKKKGDAA